MKFALVNLKRVHATPDAKGFCPCCNSELTAKCGEVRTNHWAHKGRRKCDPWWENETDWHRSWKDNFPESQQEIIQFNQKNNEKHIADVLTSDGWAIEF